MSPKLLNVLLFLVPLVLYYAYIDPMVSGTPGLVWTPDHSIPLLQTEYAQNSDALNQMETISLALKNIDKDYKALSDDDKEKVMIMLPDDIEQIKIQSEIRAIADATNVPVSAIKISQDSKNSTAGLGAYAISFTINAKYPDIKNFLELYEKSWRFYNLDSISIKQQDPKDLERIGGAAAVAKFDKEILSMALTSRVFFLR
jgi:hypothetical protein